MRRARYVAIAASPLVLAALYGAGAAPAATAATHTAAGIPPAAGVTRPGAVHAVRAAVSAQPLTTAQCVAQFKFECLNAAQIQQAYNLKPLYNQGITGQGETIVIVDSFGSPTIASDLAAFDQAFKLPAPPSLKVIQPAGKVPAYDPNDPTMRGWAGETTLDVEYAHVIAPGASILLAETPVAETEGVTGFPQIVRAETYVVNHHLGGVISQSFGAAEPTFPSAAALRALRGAYTDAAANHVTVLAATGDAGASGFNAAGTGFYTKRVESWPSIDPLVTAVGGTELNYNLTSGAFARPVAWNDTTNVAVNQYSFGNNGPNPFATGGGLSSIFSRPAYQNGVTGVVGVKRGMPDISMSGGCASRVDVYEGFGGVTPGWYIHCGTSESAPLFAGIVALADQVAGHALGPINPALYAMATAHAPGIVDVTSGNNTVSFTQGGALHTVTGFRAKAGYDLVSGIGTVNAALFVPELAKAAG